MAAQQSGKPARKKKVVGRSHGWGIEMAMFARETHSGRNWGHGGLLRLIRDVTIEEARWKPGPDAHSVLEEVNHIAYWSEDVLEQLEGRGKPRPQAWPAGEGEPDDWRRAVDRTKRLHARLVRRIAAMGGGDVARKSQKTRYSNTQLILGGVAHISYHAGRIALLKRLYRALVVRPQVS